jgi:SecD/SecF fusion protein
VSHTRRALLFLLVVVGLIAASIAAISLRPTVLGLDLQGGVEVVLQGKPTRDSQVTPEAIERSVEIIRNRVDRFGVSEPEIQTQGDDQIVVSLPGADNPGQVVEDLIKPAQLVFTDYQANLVRTSPDLYDLVKVAQRTEPDNPENGQASYYLFRKDADHTLLAGPEVDREVLLQEYDGKVPANAEVLKVPAGLVIYTQEEVLDPSRPNSPRRTVYVLMQDNPGLTGRDITEAAQSFDQAGLGGSSDPIVTMQFTGEGQTKFRDITRGLAQRGAVRQELQSFAIVLDGQIISNPTVDYRQYPTGIDGSNGAQIQGGFSVEEARTLADQLNSGAIPIQLEVISQQLVSATLGKESLNQGLIAGLAGLALVILFLIVYYRLLGVIAAVALAIYATFFFAVIVLVPITLTLPGIAGMILTIGVASDANVVIFERIREEARAGRSARSALLTGYNKGISAIIDANVVTLLTAGILFLLGTAGVKGFAFTLLVGTLLSLFTAVLVTRAVIEVGADSKWFNNEKLMGLRQREPRWKFDMVGKWRMWLAISFVPLALGAVVIGINGLNLGLDFESGTRITTAFERGQPTEDQIRAVIQDQGLGDAKIQATTDPATGAEGFQIQTRTLQPAEQNALVRALDQDLGGINEESLGVETVGPTFGDQVIRSAIWAIALSFLLLVAYLTIRFEYKLALPALLSVVHDMWLAISVYSILGAEVTSATVAALLTIMGYSLYDVVIVFDRIRENVPLMRNARYKDVVNRSVHEVLTRSIITGLTTTIPVTVLLIFGGPTLRDFALALFVGLLTGGVSSIAIAAPLAALWKEREPESKKREARARKRALKMTESDRDVVDLEVLARAEAALDGEMARQESDAPGGLLDDGAPDEPQPEPGPEPGPADGDDAADTPAPVGGGAAATAEAADGADGPTAPAAPSETSAPAGAEETPAPRPERERRHRQVQRKRRRG